MAAGEGLRIRPHSKRMPKSLLEIGGESLLARNIVQMDRSFDLEQIYVLAGYKSGQIREEVDRLSDCRAKLEVVDVPENNRSDGLLGGFGYAASYLERNERFMSVLADEYYSGDDHRDLAEFVKGLDAFSACCTVRRFAHPEEYLKNYSVVFDESSAIVAAVSEKPRKIASPYHGLGLLVADERLARMALAESAGETGESLFDLLNRLPEMTSEPVYACVYTDFYANINTITDYYSALSAYRSRRWKDFSIDVIVPAWNEAESISYVVSDFLERCDQVIVMDNESPDGTAEVARKAGATVYSEPLRGYGEAIRKGLARSTADILVLTEADGTFRAQDLDKLLCYLTNADAAVGTRTYHPYIEHGANMRPLQRLANILFGGIITVLWWNRKSRFTDVGCTFRAVWRPSLERIEHRLVGEGPEFSPEMTIELLNEWQRVIEVPVPYHARSLGTSKFSSDLGHNAITALKMLRLIVRKRVRGWLEALPRLARRKRDG